VNCSRPLRISRACALAFSTAVLLCLAGTGPSSAMSGPVSSPSGTPGVKSAVTAGASTSARRAHLLQASARGGPWAAASFSGLPQGVDVSSNQHWGGGGIDWGQVRGAGYEFALIKATEGDYYVNPFFGEDYGATKNADMYRGAYHFAIPSVSDGASQADFFLNNAAYRGDGANLAPTVDLEWNPYDSSQPCYGMGPTELVSWVTAFRDEVKHHIDRPPAIYTTASWWNQCTDGNTSFAGDPLWVAAYEVDDPPLPSGWSASTMWQYTCKGAVPGIPGEVDINYFSGPRSDLDLFAGRPRPPRAAPPPVARPT
jgi:GH25 family lysozyme M1 (1,4-beta-N-acetylmuramidase)